MAADYCRLWPAIIGKACCHWRYHSLVTAALGRQRDDLHAVCCAVAGYLRYTVPARNDSEVGLSVPTKLRRCLSRVSRTLLCRV